MRHRRQGSQYWGLLVLVLAPLAIGCATHRRVPREAASCASACITTRSECVERCAVNTGKLQILEDVRESLCGKRCGEDFDHCMLTCPGVQ